MALTSSLLLLAVGVVPAVTAGTASAAPVGADFVVTPADLAYILRQIKIAEAHVANTTSATGPCGALVGTGPNQLPSPLLSFGLRTVDGSCNNLIAGQETFGAADQKFPRLATPVFRTAEPAVVPGIGSPGDAVGPPGNTTYASKSGAVVDSQPRTVSNLIVDQTATNPAAVAAAGNPVRTQGNTGVVPCDANNLPTGCVPAGETLFIPNVTTDVGLSPPYNSIFTLFGQFFDHGVDLTHKGGSGTVFVPLKADDPLIAGPDHILGNADDLPTNRRFMVLSRATNLPGPDGVLGTADDIHDAVNNDSPWVDQSQTYTSHSSHQVFLREYVDNSLGRPVSTGMLLHSADGGMADWAQVKAQARTLLGIDLVDTDVLDVPMLAADPYGKFIPGPARGLPQVVMADGTLVEGNRAAPVTTSGARRVGDAFLIDINNNAVPGGGRTADADSVVNSTDPNNPPAPGTYDDELLDTHFAAGDGRANENIGLTAIHQIFHSEHDRLVGYIKGVLTSDTSASGVDALSDWQLATGASGWNGERLFQAARFITEMEYQHLVFEEFARKIQPAINPFQPFAFTQTDLNPAVKAEFAHAVYRFGHSMLTETIERKNADGTKNDISLLDGFLNPPSYTKNGTNPAYSSQQAAGAIFMGMSDQVGNELDEFVTDTLRNNLLGLPLDLATLNMTRARETGVPSLNQLRRQLYASTNDSQLKPYANWIDFGLHLKHPESLVNFVAAYGTHPTITVETTLAGKRAAAQLLVDPPIGTDPTTIPTDAGDFLNGTGAFANVAGRPVTGLDAVDLWVGGLAERTNLFGGLLGSTFNFVFEQQLTDLQNGDRLYYLARTPGMNLRAQLESNSFAELVMRNTDAHTLKADAFATADCKFELGNLGTSGPIPDDPASECNEPALLIRMADGTIRYRTTNSVDPPGINGQAVYNGTSGVDRIFGGVDNDTFWGNEGNDVIEGGDGADVVLGGAGDDIITDLAGDDVPKGGPGNDAIEAGPGLDIVMGGPGKDFTNGGANTNETFAGEGDDFVIAGQGEDAVFGDGGDDWEEGGDQPDLLQGDSGNLFFLDNSNRPGSDILIGQGGDDDYDFEGGDDIGVAGPGIEKVAGASGYDWQIAGGLTQGDPQAQDMDLNLPIAPLGILQVGVRDRFNEVEALSGGSLNDTLRGDDIVPVARGGAGFIGCDALDADGVARISGLSDLVPTLTTPLATVVAQSADNQCPDLSGANVWGDGNILLGGGGDDVLEGRGADDILDGDRYLSVRLSVRNAAGAEIGSAESMTKPYLPGDPTTLQDAVMAGTVNPGNIVAVREILSAPAASSAHDKAVFSDVQANYVVTTTGGTGVLGSPGSVTTVAHLGGTGPDGTDTLRNIEELVFSDTVPPAAPVIGTAVAGIGSATVNFTPPVNAAVTGFTVRVVDAAGNQVGALRPADAAAASLLVSPLPAGQTFRFQVQAVNDFGASPFSALSNAVTIAAATAAAAPTVGVASPGNTTATVSWVAPVDDGGTPLTGFVVRVVNAGTLAQVGALRAAPVTASSLTVTGLANGTSYRLQVAAVNAVGTGPFSALSNAVTPSAPATAPAAPAAPTVVRGNASATVSWVAPATGGSAITGYEVRIVNAATNVQVGALRPAGAAATSLVVTGLANGTTYRAQVRALNLIGTGAFSPLSATFTPATVPGAPTIGAPTRANASATVRWTAPAATGGTALTGYQVRVVNSATNVQVGALRPAGAAATSLVVTGLTNGTTYRAQVRAVNAVGAGPYSALSAAFTPATVPTAPVIGTAVAGVAGGTVTATANWAAPASTGGSAITGYRVSALRMSSALTTATVLGTTTSAVLPATARSLVMTLPVSGANYRFTVVAINAVGTGPASARSNAVIGR